MANTFIKPSVIARATVGVLERQIVLPRLVWRDAETEFAGKVGDTVTVRLEAIATARSYEWRTRNASITVDDIVEKSVAVALTDHLYSAAAVTDEEYTLDITDFGARIITPQVKAVARKAEDVVAAKMAATDFKSTHVIELDETSPWDTLVDARTLLNKANVPMGDRFLVVGADHEAVILKDPNLVRYDATGDSTRLGEATIGRLAGFTVIGSNAIASNVSYAFHRTAWAFATRSPLVPEGATWGQGQTLSGLAVRVMRDYDASNLRDRQITSTFAGCSVVADEADESNPEEGGATNTTAECIRAVKITDASGS